MRPPRLRHKVNLVCVLGGGRGLLSSALLSSILARFGQAVSRLRFVPDLVDGHKVLVPLGIL